MIRVLVVDDDALALELHSAYVERVPGFEVVGQAAGARAAVTALADPDRRIDLVLLDMTMPDGSGLDVARRLRATGSRVDIIAVTAVRDARDREGGRVDRGRAVPDQAVRVRGVPGAAGSVPFLRRGTGPRGGRRNSVGGRRPARVAAHRDRTGLPKGLSDETLQAVAERVRTAAGAVSSTEVGESEGMSRVTARRYLEHLADVGRVRRVPRYGGQGRPEITYAWVRG